MNKKIIGIGGRKLAGKNTAATLLTSKYSFTELSFAHPLKNLCSTVFDMSPHLFNDPALKDKPFYKPFVITDNHISKIVNSVGGSEQSITIGQIYALAQVGLDKVVASPRELLQFIGTELIRDCIGKDYWCNALRSDMEKHDKTVIPDVRLPNERAFLRSLGAYLVLVERPGLAIADSHSSETSTGDNSEYDLILNNNDSVEELHNNLDRWFLDNG